MSEPTLRRVNAYVCDLCLNGEGSECHVPGCVFWMHDVPTDDTADALRSACDLTDLDPDGLVGGVP